MVMAVVGSGVDEIRCSRKDVQSEMRSLRKQRKGGNQVDYGGIDKKGKANEEIVVTQKPREKRSPGTVSYTHLRAHET